MGRPRLCLLAAALLSASVVAPFALAASRPALAPLFAHQIRAIKRAGHGPVVLLPATMPLDARHLYPTGGPVRSGYDLELGGARRCGGADACFVAAFTAERGGRVHGRRITVKGAPRAGFVGLSCGASCSPPQIDFIWHGVLYTIQANLNTRQSDRTALVAAAQGAIAAGPR